MSGKKEDNTGQNDVHNTDTKVNLVGRNLRELRLSRGLKQEDIASSLGVSSPTYSSWERGRTEPNIAYLRELARIFDVSVDRLLRPVDRALKIGSWYHVVGKFHPIKNPYGIYTLIYRLIFNHLYYFDIFERRFHVELIDAWSADTNSDNPSYTFFLRDNLHFHNGYPLELQDVKSSYELDLEINPFFKRFINSVEIIEWENAIKLNLSRQLDLEHLPTPYIIPQTYVEAEECFEGTGPYKLVDEGQRMRVREGLQQPVALQSNNQYYGKLASIPTVEFHRFVDLEKLKERLEEGSIDVAHNFELEESDRFLAEKGHSAISYYLVVDKDSAPCKSDDFRQAVDYAIDREKIIELAGTKTADLLPVDHLYLVLAPHGGAVDISGENNYDPEKVDQFLVKATNAFARDGVTDTTLRISSSHGDPLTLKIIAEIVKQLNKVGIKAEQAPAADKANAWVQMLAFHRPYTIYGVLHSSNNSERAWNYIDPYVDSLLDSVGIGKDVYQQLQRYLSTQHVFLPLFRRGVVATYTKELDTKTRLRGTNIFYSSDVVHWEFRE